MERRSFYFKKKKDLIEQQPEKIIKDLGNKLYLTSAGRIIDDAGKEVVVTKKSAKSRQKYQTPQAPASVAASQRDSSPQDTFQRDSIDHRLPRKTNAEWSTAKKYAVGLTGAGVTIGGGVYTNTHLYPKYLTKKTNVFANILQRPDLFDLTKLEDNSKFINKATKKLENHYKIISKNSRIKPDVLTKANTALGQIKELAKVYSLSAEGKASVAAITQAKNAYEKAVSAYNAATTEKEVVDAFSKIIEAGEELNSKISALSQKSDNAITYVQNLKWGEPKNRAVALKQLTALRDIGSRESTAIVNSLQGLEVKHGETFSNVKNSERAGALIKRGYAPMISSYNMTHAMQEKNYLEHAAKHPEKFDPKEVAKARVVSKKRLNTYKDAWEYSKPNGYKSQLTKATQKVEDALAVLQKSVNLPAANQQIAKNLYETSVAEYNTLTQKIEQAKVNHMKHAAGLIAELEKIKDLPEYAEYATSINDELTNLKKEVGLRGAKDFKVFPTAEEIKKSSRAFSMAKSVPNAALRGATIQNSIENLRSRPIKMSTPAVKVGRNYANNQINKLLRNQFSKTIKKMK